MDRADLRRRTGFYLPCLPTDRPARILIVDDEPAVRALLLRALQHAGYEVVP